MCVLDLWTFGVLAQVTPGKTRKMLLVYVSNINSTFDPHEKRCVYVIISVRPATWPSVQVCAKRQYYDFFGHYTHEKFRTFDGGTTDLAFICSYYCQ